MKKHLSYFIVISFLYLLLKVDCNGQAPEYRFIYAHAANELIKSKDVYFLDVSPFSVYCTKHASGAQSFSFLRLPEIEQTFPSKQSTFILIGAGRDTVYKYLTHHQYNTVFIVHDSLSSMDSYNNTEDEWENRQLPVETNSYTKTGATFFQSLDYDVLQKDSSGNILSRARFPIPTIHGMEKYRPVHFHEYDTPNDIQGVDSKISCITLYEGKIWVGFSFYEGEGWEGYGGIGFFDTATKKIGVLRHPALVDCSVRSLQITDDKIYVSTINDFEGSAAICNGLVEIDRNTLSAVSHFPPSSSQSRNLDDPYSEYAQYYDKPISEILEDERYRLQQVPQLQNANQTDSGKRMLEDIMLATADTELAFDTIPLSPVQTILDTVIDVAPTNHDQTVNVPEPASYIQFTGEYEPGANDKVFSKIRLFIVDPEGPLSTKYIYPNFEVNTTVQVAGSNYDYLFKLMDRAIIDRDNQPKFTEARIHIVVRKFR